MNTALVAGDIFTNVLLRGRRLTVSTDSVGRAIVQRFVDGSQVEALAVVAEMRTLGPYDSDSTYRVSCISGTLTVSVTTFTAARNTDDVQASVEYARGDSYQIVAADLTLDAEAGSDDGTDPKFLSAVMGNLLGDAVAGEGNYLAGVIGAYSPTGATASDYPKAPVMGVVMDGAVGADACVMAVIDGSDPSTTTRARAAFGVAQLNNSGDSGVDYGVDLAAAGSAHYTGTGDPFTVDKAEVRFSKSDVCVLVGAGIPVDYTDGDPAASGEGFAGPGSLYIDTTNAKLYINGGTKAEPIWKIVTSAS
jgi:hypothetical protein